MVGGGHKHTLSDRSYAVVLNSTQSFGRLANEQEKEGQVDQV